MEQMSGSRSWPVVGSTLAYVRDPQALFDRQNVTIQLRCDPVSVPRDRAVAYGLIVNELVTNAAKHAFPGGRAGQITVEFRAPDTGPWVLSVSDNGVGSGSGNNDEGKTRSGLGSQLLQAFATTACGTLTTTQGPSGTTIKLVQDPRENGN